MWFTESSWPPIVGCLAVAAVLFSLWSASRRGGHLIGMIVAVALCGVIWMVERWIVTDAEEVEAAVYSLADAVEHEDAERALAHISRQAAAERALVAGGMGLIEVDGHLRVTDMQVKMLSGNSRATSHFRANGTVIERGSLQQSHVPSRWLLTWQREAGEWRVVGIERRQTLGNEKIDPLARRVD